MIHQVPIKSLPQEWLWCETWCDNASKAKAKTIDLVLTMQLKNFFKTSILSRKVNHLVFLYRLHFNWFIALFWETIPLNLVHTFIGC